MKNFTTEFRVGLFSIVAAVTTAYMFFVLSPDSFESKESRYYYTILSDAAGIIPKTHVKTNGVTIGKVKSVVLQVNRTRVEMDVDAKILIPKGSKVEIRTRGLLGDKWIEIVRVEDSGDYLEDDGYLPVSEDQVDIQRFLALMGSIAKDVKQVTNSLASALGGERGERTVANIIADIQQLAAGTKELVNENKSDVRELVGNLKEMSQALKVVLGDNQSSFGEIIDNVKGSSKDLKVFSDQMRKLVSGDNGQSLERILASFDHTMVDVEKTAKNVALVSDRIEKGEGTIGKLINDDKLIAEIQSTVKEVREALKPVNKLQIGVDYHGEIRPSRRAGHHFNVVFQTRPDKFYLLGFTDVGQTVTKTLVEAEEETATSNRSTRTVSERKRLRINAQFAKRWYFAQLRMGLFQSTGGVGADFFAWRDRFRLTVEAFDWSRKTNNFVERRVARVKAYASILFFNHIYAMIGIDDPTERYLDADTGEYKERGLDNYFIGAGLSFTDDDLKSVFGAAALAL